MDILYNIMELRPLPRCTPPPAPGPFMDDDGFSLLGALPGTRREGNGDEDTKSDEDMMFACGKATRAHSFAELTGSLAAWEGRDASLEMGFSRSDWGVTECISEHPNTVVFHVRDVWSCHCGWRTAMSRPAQQVEDLGKTDDFRAKGNLNQC